LVSAILAFAVAGWLLVAPSAERDASSHDQPEMLQVAPSGEVSLASLATEQQVLYEAAAADSDAFAAVRCYCGCESFLAHRSLRDCFERPQGGWERHATGCAVCLAEAAEVVEQRAAGVPLEAIVRRIDATYGAITATP
jgi:hypothetical protein